MSGLRKHERAALEAVARHFSATWEKGEGPPDAYLTIARKRVAVEVTTIKQRIADRGGLTTPRLRFDRVALGLVRRLQARLCAVGTRRQDGDTDDHSPHTGASEDRCRARKQNPDLSLAPVRADGGQGHDPWKSNPGSPCERWLKTNTVGDRVRAQSRFRSRRSLVHHAFIDRMHRRESREGHAGKICG